MNKIFRVVKCPNCGFFQVTGASKSLKCQKCSKSKVISYLKIYYKSDDARLAANALEKLKEKEAKEKGKFSTEFDSVI